LGLTKSKIKTKGFQLNFTFCAFFKGIYVFRFCVPTPKQISIQRSHKPEIGVNDVIQLIKNVKKLKLFGKNIRKS